MTLDFARTLLVPIATASRIKSTRLCHRRKPGNIIRDLLTSSKQDTSHLELAVNHYSMNANAVYDSASTTTDSDTTRTGYDEDDSVRTTQSTTLSTAQSTTQSTTQFTAQPCIHLSASLASSTKFSKGIRRPGYKMVARTGIPKLATTCKLRHTKIARTRPVLAAAPAPHSTSRAIRAKCAKQTGSGVEKTTGKHQRTARETTSVVSGNKTQATKKSALKTNSRSSCTALARKYGGKLESTGLFKRSLKPARSVNTKVSQAKVLGPASEPFLVQGEKILAENNSTNASETKGYFLEVKMRDGAEKGDDSEVIGTFLTRESRLQFCDASPESIPALEHSLIPSGQPETPVEKQTTPDPPQTTPGQPQVQVEQPQGQTKQPQTTPGHSQVQVEQPQGQTKQPQTTPDQTQVQVEQPQGQTRQPRASAEDPRGFKKTPSPSGVNLRSASMSSSRAKTSLTRTAPVIVSFPPVNAIADKESSQAEVKAAQPAAPRTLVKPLTLHDDAVKHSNIKRRPSMVSATPKAGLRKAASGNKIVAEKTVLQKPRQSPAGGPVQKTALTETTGMASSAKTSSDANCHRPKSCVRKPPLETMAVRRGASLARETAAAATRLLKREPEVKNVKSGSSKPKPGPVRDRNANAGHDVINGNANTGHDVINGNANAWHDVINTNANAGHDLINTNANAGHDVINGNANAWHDVINTNANAGHDVINGNANAWHDVINTNANAGHDVINGNASAGGGGSARYRRDVFVSDGENVNLNADDIEAGATQSSQKLSKKSSRGNDILNLESHKPRRESKDVEGESEALVPADEPETAEREDIEGEPGAVEKVGSMQAASKGVVGSLSSQSKHVNIQEVTRASPRVVRKKKKKRRVKKTRTEEVKEVEPVRCPLFQGWDYGTTLEKHTMDHVPMDSDITQLLLTRTTKMLWLKAGSSFKRDLLVPLQYPSAIHAEKTDVKAYLAQHGIREHFQRITNSVLEDPKSEDPLQMMINQGNVLSRQAVYQREAESLLDKMMNKQYANPISFPSFLKTEALRQAEVAESAPTVEESVDEETEEQSDEQATSTMDESATLTGKTSGSTNATNETGGK